MSEYKGDWSPSPSVVILWNVLSFVLLVLGIWFFFFLYVSTRAEGTRFSAEIGGILGSILLVVALCIAILIVHELLHGLSMRAFGARPKYGAGTFYKVMPYFYCTANGHLFTKRQYALVSITPAVVLNVVGAVWVTFLPYGGWLVIPLGMHLAGCIGDLWMVAVVARQPGGTLFEDKKTAIGFHTVDSP